MTRKAPCMTWKGPLHDLEGSLHDQEGSLHDLEGSLHDLEGSLHDVEVSRHELAAPRGEHGGCAYKSARRPFDVSANLVRLGSPLSWATQSCSGVAVREQHRARSLREDGWRRRTLAALCGTARAAPCWYDISLARICLAGLRRAA